MRYSREYKLMRLCHIDPFAEADDNNIDGKESQNYIHIRIQRAYNLPEPARICIMALPSMRNN